MFLQSQEREAKDRMKQRAKELDLQRRARPSSASKSHGTGISSNMFSNSSIDTKPDITPTPVTYPTSSPSYVLFNK